MMSEEVVDLRQPSVLLDETDRRIAAVLMAAPRTSWRTVAEVLGMSERTVIRHAAPK